MSNVRVFQLARDLGISSQEVIDRLKKLGLEVKTASSSLDEDAADKLKRAVKIESFTAKKKRVYGSEEDESERELEAQALAARIAAEREERERAAAAAKAAAEARKAPRSKAAKAEAEKVAKAGPGEEPALIHPPGAPRLAPRLATPIVLPDDDETDALFETEEAGPAVDEDVAAPVTVASAQAPPAPPAPVRMAPPAPTPAPTPVMRPIGTLRPIAPQSPPAPRPDRKTHV